MSTGRKRRVIEGNTVRKLQVREERHYRRQEESHAYRVERDQKIQYTTVIYMLFLTIAGCYGSVVMCNLPSASGRDHQQSEEYCCAGDGAGRSEKRKR